MIDINDSSFIQNFDMRQMTVGQIGHGYIGKAVRALFQDHCNVLVYDKFKEGSGYSSLEYLVKNCQVIFVAVPTPMKQSTGECHTDIIESVLQDIQNAAVSEEVDLSSFIVVTKSTVPPGFTKRMQKKFVLRIVFSPEFLTESNSIQDFQKASRVILGGDLEDCQIVYKYFEAVWPGRIHDQWVDHADGPVVICQCDPTVAELTKLSTNAHLMAKVLLSNELYLICEKLGVSYNDVKHLTQLDQRIGRSHMDVPGPDSKLGSGGSCFPKDINNLRHVSQQLGTGERLFTAIHERNIEIRGADWQDLKGRAVVDD